MNTHKLKLALGLFVFSCVISPVAAEAYFTTAQSATKLTDDTSLYTVTYKFGFLNRELYMPITAVRGLATSSPAFSVGYDLLTPTNTVVTSGFALGIVLTDDEDVEIRDNAYYLPEGRSAEFTLMTVVRTTPGAQEGTSLLMTHLPFTMIKGDEVIKARLNPSELQYYRTPAVTE